jgi:hypothetical protein
VLKAERVLKAQTLAVDAVSVPRRISSDCGIGIRFDCLDRQKLEEILAENKVEISGIYDE